MKPVIRTHWELIARGYLTRYVLHFVAMRDPDRIEPIIEALWDYWRRNPDLRLGQIIANAASLPNSGIIGDPFYIEDDKMLEGIRRQPHPPL